MKFAKFYLENLLIVQFCISAVWWTNSWVCVWPFTVVRNAKPTTEALWWSTVFRCASERARSMAVCVVCVYLAIAKWSLARMCVKLSLCHAREGTKCDLFEQTTIDHIYNGVRLWGGFIVAFPLRNHTHEHTPDTRNRTNEPPCVI